MRTSFLTLILTLLGCGIGWAAPDTPNPVAVWEFEYEENLIWVKARVADSAPLNFILDSASSEYVLDSDTAADLGVRSSENEIVVKRTDGQATHTVSIPQRLELENIRIEGVPFITMPLNRSTPGQRHIDGILGAPFFEHFLVQINFQNSSIRLYSRGDSKYFEQFPQHELRLQDGLMGLDLVDHDGRPGLFVLDTGCSQGILISPHARESFLPTAGKNNTIRSIYAGGTAKAVCYSETSWRFGGQTVNDLNTLYCRNSANGLLSDRRWAGIVGNGFLSRFVVTIDKSAERMFIQPTG